MAELNFDTTGQEELRASSSQKNIPSGEYTAKIMGSEYLKNSKKTGYIYKFLFKIIGG